jgi:hypothetical protein
VCVPFI